LEGDEKFKFDVSIDSKKIPSEFHEPIFEGVRESLCTGTLAGYPITDIKVTLIDGSYDDEDSSNIAFKIAASKAFREAYKNAKPILLEPVMKIEILVQDEYLGEIISDLNARDGKINKPDPSNNAFKSEASIYPGTIISFLYLDREITFLTFLKLKFFLPPARTN
jgi:elongation factor G